MQEIAQRASSLVLLGVFAGCQDRCGTSKEGNAQMTSEDHIRTLSKHASTRHTSLLTFAAMDNGRSPVQCLPS